MNYETVMSNIKTGHTVTITHVNEVVDDLLNAYEEDEEQSWEHFNELMGVLTAPDIQTYNGDEDNYHNLAVSLARAGQYGFACDVLRLGLGFYGKSQDLLADFLAYAAKCNGRRGDDKTAQEAEACYQKLIAIDRALWDWRAFDFSIDYLSAKLSRETESEKKTESEKQEINDSIDELLAGYQKYHSRDEKAYLAQYVVDLSRNEKEAEKKLQKKIEELAIPAPRCRLKLAEHFFQAGRYEEAEVYIGYCKNIAPSMEQAVEPGNIYALSALCGMCRIYEEGIENLKENNKLEERVKRVYNDCAAAHAIYLKRRFREYKNLEIQRDVLEKLSGITYEEE